MKFRALIGVALIIMLVACGKPQATCSDDASKAALESAIREGLEKVVAARSKDSEGNQLVGFSKIRAAIANIKLVLENIRTTKEDPNSTKKFCSGNLKIVFGTQVFNDADKAREIAGLSNLNDATSTVGIEKGVDYLQGDLEYSVQPTDDGTKVVALAVLDAPKISDGEVEKFALQKNVLEAVLRQIPLKRRFMKNYIVVRNLVSNPRTPTDVLCRIRDPWNLRRRPSRPSEHQIGLSDPTPAPLA